MFIFRNFNKSLAINCPLIKNKKRLILIILHIIKNKKGEFYLFNIFQKLFNNIKKFGMTKNFIIIGLAKNKKGQFYLFNIFQQLFNK